MLATERDRRELIDEFESISAKPLRSGAVAMHFRRARAESEMGTSPNDAAVVRWTP